MGSSETQPLEFTQTSNPRSAIDVEKCLDYAKQNTKKMLETKGEHVTHKVLVTCKPVETVTLHYTFTPNGYLNFNV